MLCFLYEVLWQFLKCSCIYSAECGNRGGLLECYSAECGNRGGLLECYNHRRILVPVVSACRILLVE